jgi:hypothetical protein
VLLAGTVAVAGTAVAGVVAVAGVEAAPLLVEGAVPLLVAEDVFLVEEDAFFFFDGGWVSSPWNVWATAEPTRTSGRTRARDRSERNMSASPR